MQAARLFEMVLFQKFRDIDSRMLVAIEKLHVGIRSARLRLIDRILDCVFDRLTVVSKHSLNDRSEFDFAGDAIAVLLVTLVVFSIITKA